MVGFIALDLIVSITTAITTATAVVIAIVILAVILAVLIDIIIIIRDIYVYVIISILIYMSEKTVSVTLFALLYPHKGGVPWTIRRLVVVSCPDDPDVWMRPAKQRDGSEYYEYILLYTNDALVVSENAEHVLRTEVGRYWILKEEPIGPPKFYLGGDTYRRYSSATESNVEPSALPSSLCPSSSKECRRVFGQRR